MPTPKPTPVLFPFEPDAAQPLAETWSWVTDLFSSHNDTESRRALRFRPGMKLSWLVTTIDDAESERIFGLMFNNVSNWWYVPMWPYARKIADLSAGDYTPDSMVDSRFDWSDKVLVWRSSSQYDIMDVEAVDITFVQLSGVVTFDHSLPGTRMVPLGQGALIFPKSWDRTQFVGSGTVEFELDSSNTVQIEALSPAQSIDGFEVLTIHPISETGTEQENWNLSAQRIGGNIGPFLYRPFSPSPIVDRQMSWVAVGRSSVEEFKAWLNLRKGRQAAFFAATYVNDLILAAAPVAGNSYIDILACDFASKFLASPARSYVALLQHPATIAPLKVTGVTSPSAGIERLATSAPLAQSFGINTRVSFLVLSRFDTDNVKMTYETADTISVTIPLKEIPREL